MDVLTSETCWALSKEIIKQVTSSWSLFTQLIFSCFHCTRRLWMSLHPVLIIAHVGLQFPFCLAKQIQHNSSLITIAQLIINSERVETLTCTDGRWKTFQSYRPISLGPECEEANRTDLSLRNCKTPPRCFEQFNQCTIPLKNKKLYH